MKMVVQRTEEVVICRVRWMAQCLSAKLLHGIPDHVMPGIVMEEQYTLVINQCWLLLFQCLLHLFQLL